MGTLEIDRRKQTKRHPPPPLGFFGAGQRGTRIVPGSCSPACLKSEQRAPASISGAARSLPSSSSSDDAAAAWAAAYWLARVASVHAGPHGARSLDRWGPGVGAVLGIGSRLLSPPKNWRNHHPPPPQTTSSTYLGYVAKKGFLHPLHTHSIDTPPALPPAQARHSHKPHQQQP